MEKRKLQPSSVKNLFKFVSAKNNALLTVESSLEFDACFHFEYATQVTSFDAQPLGYEYSLNGKMRTYTPDFLLRFQNGQEQYIEIKPSFRTTSSEFREMFEAKQQEAISLGRELVLVTERQIRRDAYLKNLKLLHHYSGIKSLTPLHLSLLNLVARLGKPTLGYLAQELSEHEGNVLKTAIELCALRRLSTDLTSNQISINNYVWL